MSGCRTIAANVAEWAGGPAESLGGLDERGAGLLKIHSRSRPTCRAAGNRGFVVSLGKNVKEILKITHARHGNALQEAEARVACLVTRTREWLPSG